MNGELFKISDRVKIQAAHPNPMVRKAGIGPEGAKCKGCKFLIRTKPSNRVYYKCKFVGVTHGAATDVRVRWDACRMYEVEGEPAIDKAVRNACAGGKGC
ncbi:hypothetical protein KAR91_61110 [Candidatus Pacearchaeota archaeon]|nr:hypothetical protein [Candidatus Pacearchaeota archaeon]